MIIFRDPFTLYLNMRNVSSVPTGYFSLLEVVQELHSVVRGLPLAGRLENAHTGLGLNLSTSPPGNLKCHLEKTIKTEKTNRRLVKVNTARATNHRLKYRGDYPVSKFVGGKMG